MPDLRTIIINGKEFTGFVSPIESAKNGEDGDAEDGANYEATVGREKYLCKKRDDRVYVGIRVIKDEPKTKEKRRLIL